MFPSVSKCLEKIDNLIYEFLSEKENEKGNPYGKLVERSDCLVAKYDGKKKAKFTKHVDNTSKDGRKLACVLYLNKKDNWNVKEDGGCLTLHNVLV